MKSYYVYILSNHSRTLYVGVTNDLERRIFEHKTSLIEGFSKLYKLHKLVHFEETSDVREAIRREKELKGWVRRKKVDLIEEKNPFWVDLSESWS